MILSLVPTKIAESLLFKIALVFKLLTNSLLFTNLYGELFRLLQLKKISFRISCRATSKK